MKKLIFAAPFAFIFISPWFIKLSAMNIAAAIPQGVINDPYYAATVISSLVLIFGIPAVFSLKDYLNE